LTCEPTAASLFSFQRTKSKSGKHSNQSLGHCQGVCARIEKKPSYSFMLEESQAFLCVFFK